MADYLNEHWFKLLADAAAADPRGNQGVAERLGISRTQVSLVLNGKYASPKKIAALVLAAFDRRICPHDQQEKQPDQCKRIALRPRPHGFPDAETLWLCCQTCPHKPVTGGQS